MPKGIYLHKKGYRLSITSRKNIGNAKLGEKNPMWVGDKIKYTPLHKWIRSRIVKPEFCEDCKKIPPYDIANRGKYTRDLKQWEWLCRKCHMIKDGRLKRFVKQAKTKSLITKKRMSIARKKYFKRLRIKND